MKLIHKRRPSKKDITISINKLIGTYKEINEKFEVFNMLFDSTSGDLFESVYMTFDLATEMTARALGINWDDLSWFIYDNQCGENKFSVSVTDKSGNVKTTVIDGVDSFVDYLTS